MSPRARPTQVVPIPRRLSRRPKDARGYPIGCLVLITPDGKPDFRATDVRQWLAIVRNRCCALCGEPLESNIAFIGGPRSHESRTFTDPGMHLECAQYAMKVCPYLAMPTAHHSRKITPIAGLALKVTEHVSTEKPDRFFIGIAMSYHPYRLEDGSLVVRASEWIRTEWFAA